MNGKEAEVVRYCLVRVLEDIMSDGGMAFDVGCVR